jgi:glycosyltransferase involved in cell wall biosynthesis
MSAPFFSVVIPTKNRAFLVGYAIQSVLNQTFQDFEIVISDNDDTDETRRVVDQFSDSRIRYQRSGRLSMPDNWEYGCSFSSGEFTTILEDKGALKPGALERAYLALESGKHDVVSWKHDSLRRSGAGYVPVRPNGLTGQMKAVPSDELLARFLSTPDVFANRSLPRGLNSVASRSLMEKIRNGPVGRVFLLLAPDYTFAYQTLAFTDHVLCIDDALVTFGATDLGNGMSFILKSALSKQFSREISANDHIFYDKVPIKEKLVGGTLLNDYQRVRTLLGGRLARHPVNMVNYFRMCKQDIERSKSYGVDMAREEASWRAALLAQGVVTTTETLASLARDNAVGKLQVLASRLGVRKVRRLLGRKRPGSVSIDVPNTTTFANVLEYVQWEEKLRKA